MSLNTIFEKEVCGRCGGTGKYSYCQVHGTKCFGCAGAGEIVTKRGFAARAHFRVLLADFRTNNGGNCKGDDFISIQAQALEYQSNLTKAGTVRKKAA